MTNGSTLTLDLLEHESFRKLECIDVSFAGHDKESYEETYQLKYEKVIENVLAMHAAFPGRLIVKSVHLVRFRDHKSEFERF